MMLGPNTRYCFDDDAPDPDTPEGEARIRHSWNGTGLHVVDGVLCSTRRCVWCRRAEHTRYGAKRTNWRKTNEAPEDAPVA